MVINKIRDRNCLSACAFSVNLLLISFSTLTFQQLVSVNASCILPNGENGECVKFEECRSATFLSQKDVNSRYCSLEDGLVCCAVDRNPDSTSDRKERNIIINNYYGEKNINSHLIEEPYQYETPNFYPDVGYNERPSRWNNHGKNDQAGGNHFIPPGLSKKKSWGEEKTTEPNYYFENVTRKPNRGPNKKGANKNTGGNSRKQGDVNTTRRPNWSGRKSTTDDNYYYNVQNEYEQHSNNHRTTERNPWEQSYVTKRPGYSNGGYEEDYSNPKPPRPPSNRPTRRPEYSISGGGNKYGGNEDDHSNIKPPRRPSDTRRPEYSNTGGGNNYGGHEEDYSNPKPPRRPSNGNPNRPQNQGNKRPSHNQPHNQGNKKPNQQQGSNIEGNRSPTYQQGSNIQGNQTNYQQGSNYGGNRPNSRPQKKKSLSEQKCEEYSKPVTESITGLPLTTDPDPVVISFRKCVTPQQLIVGGENTTLGEFPHMAAIGFRDKDRRTIAWLCGGTLISDLFVMTAAHCASTSSGRPVKVRLGEYNLKQNDDGAHPVEYAVVNIVIHPDYKPPSKYNDIALLKLSRRVTISKSIRPACLYTEDMISITKAIATGWGRTNYDGESSDILQKVVLSIVDNPTCNRFYKVNRNTGVLSRGIIDTQICAGEITGGKDTCQGDSGGPLSITSTNCIHHIIGITSFGKSCALPNSTGVYTKVSAYVPWIESIVWQTY